MTTFTTYANGTSTVNTAVAAASFPAVTTLEQTFDATKRVLAATDVVELISIPAGTHVLNVYVEVLEGEATAAQTLNVGDGVDPDGYVAAATVATTGARVLGAGAIVGKLYSAADTIDIAVPATMAYASLKVRVVAMVTMLG